MANIKQGLCPSCGKERPLASFAFGVIKTTLCLRCLSRYLDKVVIPNMLKNERTEDDTILIGGDYVEN